MKHRENPWISLLVNIAIPTLILTRASGEHALGPVYGLLLALAFPVGYGMYDYTRENKANFFSIIGIVSVLLTGGMSLLQFDPKYIAYKEAGVPLVIGIVILAMRTKYPVVKTLLSKMIDITVIYQRLKERGNEREFEATMATANLWFAFSFFVSSILNFALAKVIVTSQPGSEAYNVELGRMIGLSYPVIALPVTVMMAFVIYSVVMRIQRLTQLEIEEIIMPQQKQI